MRLRERVEVLNGGAKSPVEERLAFAFVQGASHGRIKAQAFFALAVRNVPQLGARQGWPCLPHRYSIDLRMLLEGVYGHGRWHAHRPIPSRRSEARP